MICYNDIPALLVHSPNVWEDDPRKVFLYARGQGIKTRNSKNKKEGGVGGAVSKTAYAESVYLTASEHEKLTTRYGERNTRRAIDKLSAYKGAKGKRYKSDYKAILNWAMGAVLGTKSAAVPEPLKVSTHPVCDLCGKVCERDKYSYWTCPAHGRRDVLNA